MKEILALLAVIVCSASSSAVSYEWNVLNPVNLEDYSAIYYSPVLNRVIATGGATNWISDDQGDTWYSVYPCNGACVIRAYLGPITYWKGSYWALGGEGGNYLATWNSEDLLDWTVVGAGVPVEEDSYMLVGGDDIMLCLQDDLYGTTDGIVWSYYGELPQDPNNFPWAITYDPTRGQFIAYIAPSTLMDTILFSKDGKSWSSIGGPYIYGVTDMFITEEGHYLISGWHGVLLQTAISMSKDGGETWQVIFVGPVPGLFVDYFVSISYDDTRGIAVALLSRNTDEMSVYISTDLNNWKSTYTFNVTDLVTTPSFVVTDSTFILYGPFGGIFLSTDGIQWNFFSSSGILANFASVDYIDGVFFGCTDSGLFSSTDAATWVKLNNQPGVECSGVRSNGTVYVTWEGSFYYSKNLSSWQSVPVNGNPNIAVFGVVATPKMWVFLGIGATGSVLSGTAPSHSLEKWEISTSFQGVSSLAPKLIGIVASESSFYALANTTLWQSHNGLNWTTVYANNTATFNGVASGNGLVVIVGASTNSENTATTWYAKVDSTSFTACTPDVMSFLQFLDSVTYDPIHNAFLATGAEGNLWVSTDGCSWTFSDSGVTSQLTSISFYNKGVVAVGQNGVSIVSPNSTK